MKSLREKAAAFRALHQAGKLFIMPNAWDKGSAKMLEAAGFAAIATTSAGVNWSAGRRDYVYEVSGEEMLGVYGEIANAVDVPVSGDLENGYGPQPEDVANCIRQAIAQGMAGGGIEDFSGDDSDPLLDRSLAVERIRAGRAAADESGIEFTLTARCEAYYAGLDDPYSEVVERCNLFFEAGADCVFAPGIGGREAIGNFVRDVAGPVNMVAGLTEPQLTAAELADLGVVRISTGGSIARACLGVIERAARELRDKGTFDYLGLAISDEGSNTLFN